ncbi:MAG: MFS transporter [Pseudonocardiales bacterium]|nr:MFS transporter [Pseudonocardiales bacterium]
MPTRRVSPFTFLFTASTVSNLGDGLRIAALPLVAAALTRNDLLVAAIISANRLPWLAAPLIGTLVDFRDRRQVMIVVDLIRAVCTAGIGVMLFTRTCTVALLAAAGFLLGVGEVFFDTASIAITPALVGGAQLYRGNARIISGQTAANQFAGQPLGGLAAAVSPALPFLADGVSFIASVLLLRRIGGDFRPRAVPTRSRVLAEMMEGMRWLVRQRTLAILTVSVGVLGIAGGAVQATLVLLVRYALGGGLWTYGLVLGIGAVGSLAGALFSAWFLAKVGFRAALVCSVIGGALTYLALGASPDLLAASLAFLGIGATVVLWNVATVTARQRLAPDRLLGRVQAAYRMVAWGTYPIGGMVGGLLAWHVGERAPALLAAGLLLLLLPLVFLVPTHDATTTVVSQSRDVSDGEVVQSSSR